MKKQGNESFLKMFGDGMKNDRSLSFSNSTIYFTPPKLSLEDRVREARQRAAECVLLRADKYDSDTMSYADAAANAVEEWIIHEAEVLEYE